MAEKIVTAGQSSGNLNFATAQKIINRLLTHGRIKTDLDEGRIRGLGSKDDKPVVKIRGFTKVELAEKLGITLEELDKLKSSSFYEGMVNKISLALVRLYCSTKFIDGEYKGKQAKLVEKHYCL